MSDDGEGLDPARTIRRLMRGADKACMATHHATRDGWPYGSLVLHATAPDGAPLLLLSDLSDHVKNLKADARASLLFDGTAGLKDPLTGARVSVLGRLRRTGDKGLKARFLARHPTALLYAGFADFNVYRMTLEAAHLVAGFGRIHWLSAAKLRLKGIDIKRWADGEAALVARLNGPQLDLVGAGLGRRSAAARVRVTGADPEGLDVQAGPRRLRLEFDRPIQSPRGVAAALRRLAR